MFAGSDAVAVSVSRMPDLPHMIGSRDAATGAFGRRETFPAVLEAMKLDGTLTSVDLGRPPKPGRPVRLGYYQCELVTSLRSAGSHRLRPLFAVAGHGPTDLSQWLTHRVPLSATD